MQKGKKSHQEYQKKRNEKSIKNVNKTLHVYNIHYVYSKNPFMQIKIDL